VRPSKKTFYSGAGGNLPTMSMPHRMKGDGINVECNGSDGLCIEPECRWRTSQFCTYLDMEATNASDKEIVVDLVVEEGVAEDTPPVKKIYAIFFEVVLNINGFCSIVFAVRLFLVLFASIIKTNDGHDFNAPIP